MSRKGSEVMSTLRGTDQRQASGSPPKRRSPLWLWFSLPIAALAMAGSAAGILVDSVYSKETDNWGPPASPPDSSSSWAVGERPSAPGVARGDFGREGSGRWSHAYRLGGRNNDQTVRTQPGACCITSGCPRSRYRLHHQRCPRSLGPRVGSNRGSGWAPHLLSGPR